MFKNIEKQTMSLKILDLKTQYEDGDSADAIVTAKVIQGLVNRSLEEKMYFYNDCTDITHEIGGRTWNVQQEWLNTLEDLKRLPQLILERCEGQEGGLHRLLLEYRGILRGMIIWDDNPHKKVNMAACAAAVTIASQQEAIAVSPDIAKKVEEWGIDLPVLEDLRRFHFNSDHQLMKWSVDCYLKTSNQELKSVFSLGADGWAPNHIWGDNWISNTIFQEGPIDYAVAVNGFCFNINVSDGNDEEALLYLLSHFKEGECAILGWVPSHPFLYGFSETPQCLNRTSYFVMGVNGLSNLSVYAVSKEKKMYRKNYQAANLEEDTVYIAFLATDGDALHCVYRGMYAAFGKNRDIYFGSTPITWSMNPVLAQIAPSIYSYFIEQLPQTSDYIIGWADKINTIYDTKSDCLISTIKEYADLSGIKTIWTVNSDEETQHAEIGNWDAVVEGYSNSRTKAHVSNLREKTAVFGTWDFETTDAKELAGCIKEMCESENSEYPPFYFITLGASFENASEFYKTAAETAEILKKDTKKKYCFLNAGEMAKTFQLYRKR